MPLLLLCVVALAALFVLVGCTDGSFQAGFVWVVFLRDRLQLPLVLAEALGLAASALIGSDMRL
jgi:hypothetical protein